MQGDYSMVMPFLAKALLDKRARLATLREALGEDALRARHPAAAGTCATRRATACSTGARSSSGGFSTRAAALPAR